MMALRAAGLWPAIAGTCAATARYPIRPAWARTCASVRK